MANGIARSVTGAPSGLREMMNLHANPASLTIWSPRNWKGRGGGGRGSRRGGEREREKGRAKNYGGERKGRDKNCVGDERGGGKGKGEEREGERGRDKNYGEERKGKGRIERQELCV